MAGVTRRSRGHGWVAYLVRRKGTRTSGERMLHRLLPEARDPAPGADPHANLPAGFPLRVAAVDVGSNALRFMAAEFDTPATFRVLDLIRTPIRLGHDVFLTGRLEPAAMAAAVAALRSYRGRMAAIGVARHRAVATSAVRDGENGAAFVQRVREEAGLDLEIITGAEEARLVHQAVRHRVDLTGGRWLLGDLGGGSLEVSLVDHDEIHWSESHGMGSVRLLEELSMADDEPDRFSRRLREYAATLRIPASGRSGRVAGLIATGGNIEALTRIGREDAAGELVSILSLARLRELIDALARRSFRQRVDELGLREDRADVILPAALVYDRLCELAGVDRVHVPNVGLRDGIILDLVDADQDSPDATP